MKNIILIGYRCTGKTTVGKKLSERLGLPFIDTDGLVMLDTGMSVDEIVREGGWPLFRRKEREVIEGLLSAEGTIIAPGGGALEEHRNRRGSPIALTKATALSTPTPGTLISRWQTGSARTSASSERCRRANSVCKAVRAVSIDPTTVSSMT